MDTIPGAFLHWIIIEIEQLNFIDAYEKCQEETRQANATRKIQGIDPGDRTYKPLFQNFTGVEIKDKQAQQQRQEESLDRMIKMSAFPCQLGCRHTVPWGSMQGCGKPPDN